MQRLQFPIALAFAMTIKKSQGQSLDKVAIYLLNSVFTHRQLYVALSRAKSFGGVKIFIEESSKQNILPDRVDLQQQILRAKKFIKSCVNNKPLPLMVQVNDCTELPCDFFKNDVTYMAIQFVATKDKLLKMRAALKITTLGVDLPFELPEELSDICRNLMFGAYCPLYNGEDVTYHLMMTLSENQPEVPIKVEVKLIDNLDDDVIACFVVDGRVKKHLSR